MIEYKPNENLTLGLTNWVGPGFVLTDGKPLRHPFPQGAYGGEEDEFNTGGVVENWQGPNLFANRGGTLYFVDAKASWRVRPDLTLSAEYLFARTGSSEGPFGWAGWMVMADYDVNDRVHLFARYSALDDTDWIVTGSFQKCSEISGGFGWEFYKDFELRCEYRHDFSNVNPDVDSVSVHLTWAF